MISQAIGLETDLVGHVLGTAPSDGRTALIDYSHVHPQRWSYAALKAAIAALAAHLRSTGLQEDDVVAVLAENSAEFVISYYGVLAAGGVVLPLDPRAAEAEWRKTTAECDATTIIADTALWRTPSSFPLSPVLIGAGPVPGTEGRPWDEAITSSVDGSLPASSSGRRRTAVLMSSSGTQGPPKMVQVTHGNLVAGLEQIAKVHRLGDGDVVTCAGPLRHIYGMQMAMNPALHAGSALVIAPARFELYEFLRIVAVEKVSVAYLVPFVIGGIASLPVPPSLPALRLIVSGGGPLPATAAEGCTRKLRTPVVQGFGMTEAGCISFTADDRPGPLGSVGTILPGTEARFLDPDTGEPVDRGQPGELALRGPQVSPGYLGASAPPIGDDQGWFRTGDLALLDQEGFLRIVGRIKSLIKYKGHQVAPAEIEGLLLEHHAVEDVVVIGQPDPLAGEIPKAFVVASRDVSLAELEAHVAARVSPYKRVRAMERVHEIPRSATGKAMRPPPLRIVVLGGSSRLASESAAGLATAGMSVLIMDAQAAADGRTAVTPDNARTAIVARQANLASSISGTDAAAEAVRELGGLDVILDARTLPPVEAGDELGSSTCVDPVLGGLLRLFDFGRGRVIFMLDQALERNRLPKVRAAHRDFVARVATETVDAGVCVAGFEPGSPDGTGAVRDTMSVVALVTGAADHCSGHCFGSDIKAVDRTQAVPVAHLDTESIA